MSTIPTFPSFSTVHENGWALYVLRQALSVTTTQDDIAKLLKRDRALVTRMEIGEIPTPPGVLAVVARELMHRRACAGFAIAPEQEQLLIELNRILKETTMMDGSRRDFQPFVSWSALCLEAERYLLPTRLPLPPHPFLGRKHVITVTEDYLLHKETNCLLILTGVAGIGKSVLAAVVARKCVTVRKWITRYPDGVVFVDLTAVQSPHLLLATIARALGIPEAKNISWIDTLVTALRGKRLLLILDSFEHLLNARSMIMQLLERSPGLSIIITTQLWVADQEHNIAQIDRYTYEGLSIRQKIIEVEALASSLERPDAMRLFIHHAARYMPLTETDSDVVDICRRVNGIPLAIELVASWLRVRTIEQVLAILPADTPDPQVTKQRLTSLLDISTSVALLRPYVQRMFMNLAMFTGSFDCNVATTVCANPEDEILEGLAILVDYHLLRITESSRTQRRFSMPPPIYAYARQHLQASPTYHDIAHRYIDWYTHFVHQAVHELRTPQQHVWLQRIEDEYPNIGAALEMSMTLDPPTQACMLGADLWQYFWLHGDLTEGRTWLRQLLPIASAQPSVYHQLLIGAAALAHAQGDLEEAATWGAQGLAAAQTVHDPIAQATAFIFLGAIRIDQRQTDQALHMLQTGLAMVPPDDLWLYAWGLHMKGRALCEQSLFSDAQTELEHSLALARSLGDSWLVAMSLNWLGRALLDAESYGRAAQCWEESKALFERLHHKLGVAYVLYGECEAAARQGAYQEAYAITQERLSIEESLKNLQGIASASSWLGWISLATQHMDDAERYLLESLGIYQQLHDYRGIAEVELRLAQLAIQNHRLDQAVVHLELSLPAKSPYTVDTHIVMVLWAYANLAFLKEHLAKAATILGAVAVYGQTTGVLHVPLRQRQFEQQSRQIRTLLKNAVYDAAYHKGAGLPFEQALTFAQSTDG